MCQQCFVIRQGSLSELEVACSFLICIRDQNIRGVGRPHEPTKRSDQAMLNQRATGHRLTNVRLRHGTTPCLLLLSYESSHKRERLDRRLDSLDSRNVIFEMRWYASKSGGRNKHEPAAAESMEQRQQRQKKNAQKQHNLFVLKTNK